MKAAFKAPVLREVVENYDCTTDFDSERAGLKQIDRTISGYLDQVVQEVNERIAKEKAKRRLAKEKSCTKFRDNRFTGIGECWNQKTY